jgi:hypothetical protein
VVLIEFARECHDLMQLIDERRKVGVAGVGGVIWAPVRKSCSGNDGNPFFLSQIKCDLSKLRRPVIETR